MKNKKALSTFVATLIILLLVFVAVGIIYVVIKNVLEQEGNFKEFKITKEECWNETIRLEYRVYLLDVLMDEIMDFHEDYREQGCLYYWKYGILNESILCTKMHEESLRMQREIEKVRDSMYEIEEICNQVEVDCMQYKDLNGRTCLGNCCRTKKDLTTEWLNENCDCTKGDVKNCVLSLFDNGTETVYGCDKAECLEYKCGDYTVEVLK